MLLRLLIVLNICFYLAVSIATIWSCIPRSKIWRPIEEGSCMNLGAMLIASAAINMISDIFLFVIPIYRVWQLQLSMKKKVGVSSVFLIGSM